MTKRLLQLDEELFVKALTRAVEDGNAEFVAGHRQRLDSLVDKLNLCLRELADLQDRVAQVGGELSSGAYQSLPPASCSAMAQAAQR